jgi:predicted ArsR family transcriptional regulator
MDEFIIETQVDNLIDLLNKRRKITLSEAARILNVRESQVEQWVGTLEDRGVVELKYPVLGEPEIVIKSVIPENLKIEAKKQEVKPEEVIASNEEVKEEMHEEVREKQPEEKMEKSYPEAKEILEVEEKEIKDVTERISNLEKKLTEVSEEVDISKLKEDLFETLIIISSLENTERITSYISHIERIILFLKAKNILDKTDRDLIVSTLKNVSENWKYEKNEEIAKIFDEMIKKIETI